MVWCLVKQRDNFTFTYLTHWHTLRGQHFYVKNIKKKPVQKMNQENLQVI
jgi:hypothetical protein